MRTKPVAIIVGPTPPPYHGMTTATLTLLASPALNGAYDLVHLDTADRRSQDNMGRLDLGNVRLGLLHAWRLAALLVRHRPDVVLIPVAQNRWGYVRDAALIALCRAARVPVLTHLNGAGFRKFYDEADPVTRLVVRITSRWLHGVGVLGGALLPIYDGLVSGDRLHVLPNGIEDPFPGGPPPRRGTGVPRVTYMSTLIRSKGFPALITAAAELRDAGVEARFTLAGAWNSEEERAEGLGLVERFDLEGVVDFPGVVSGDSKLDLLASSDIFVLPTSYPPEGQPFSILEAMAAGLPTVTTARGAIPEMIVEGETGVLVPEGDVGALVAALRRLIEAPDERRSLGAAARRRYLDRFTAEANARRLVEAMDETRRAAGRLEGQDPAAPREHGGKEK